MKNFALVILIICTFQNLIAEVQVIPVPKSKTDKAIENRINKIFLTTDWFPKLELNVDEGVVFLKGSFATKEKKEWALKLIERMEGVVATVDKTETDVEPSFAISPIHQELNDLFKKTARQLPYIVFAILIFALFCVLAFYNKKIILNFMTKRESNALLANAIASITSILVLLIGLYLALRTSGLSALAFTVLGGTGFIGIGIALALKGSIENYASGLVISLRNLFKQGEIVSINEHEGVVHSVSTRGTTLMDYEGNHIIIPNSMIFNSVVKNLTRSPSMRADFIVGIGYSESIDVAKKVILDTIKAMSGIILTDPKPIVTTDSLAAATANLRIYFWFNSNEQSRLKVKSMLMQKVKENLMNANISLPDDAREVIFASPLRVITEKEIEVAPTEIAQNIQTQKKVVNEQANIDLHNEIDELKSQSAKTEPAESGENILEKN